MELQEFLKKNPKDYEAILSAPPFCLKIQHEDGYVLFKYDQLNSDFSLPIVREARGIIFREDNFKCVRRSFDKFFNVQEPNAAKIDWDTAWITEKVDGCFTQDDAVMLADGTSMKIGEIVKNKLPVEVLSYNFKTQRIEPKKVCGWKVSENTRPVSDWRTISVKGNKAKLRGKIPKQCFITPTKNHIFFSKNQETGEMVEKTAGDLVVGDVVYVPRERPTRVEKQVILGTLLGDGSCTYYQEQDNLKNKGIRFSHSIKQKDYVQYKASFLMPRFGGRVKEIYVENSFSHEKYIYQSLVHPSINFCYNLIYKNYHKKVTNEVLEELDWLGFAIWYMDDGSLDTGPKNNGIFLHTEGFSLEENETIVKFYTQKGYRCNMRKDGRGHIYIHFSTEASEKIFSEIRTYICPSMQYKLPERHQGFYEKVKDQEQIELGLEELLITKIEDGLQAHNRYRSKSLYCYDIEVEDNHNYFCQGVLVHNSLCCAWADKGKWHLSTNGQIDAFKTPTGSILYPTFGSLFERALKEYNYNSFEEFCEQLPEGQCQTFELCTEENRIVIPYKGFHIYYLGSYLLDYECEQYYRDWADMSLGVELPQTYRAVSMEKLIERASKLPWDEEGYVVCDGDFNRVKVKSTQWLNAHYTLNNNMMTRKRLIDVILAGEEDEFLTFGEKYKDELEKIHLKMNEFQVAAESAHKDLDNFTYKTRAEYAEAVKFVPNPTIRNYLFYCYDYDLAWTDFVKNWDSNKWDRVLDQEI